MTDACFNCRFYLADPGVCRRFPPATLIERVSPGRVTVTSEFPRMKPHGWRGEHKPKAQ